MGQEGEHGQETDVVSRQKEVRGSKRSGVLERAMVRNQWSGEGHKDDCKSRWMEIHEKLHETCRI